MKGAAYLRVSTENQTGEDRYGMESQRQAIKEYCRAQGIDIIAWYEDPGISGSTLDRPGLQQLLSDASQGEFQQVIVAKMDRVARDLYASLFIEKQLLIHDIPIISVSEPLNGNDDPAVVLFRQMVSAFAQFEKGMITARLSGGRKEKARSGGYAGGGVSLGYQAKRGQKVIELDPAKVDTVKRIFELRDGRTLQEIADQLNEEGHRTAQGSEFRPTQVMRVLKKESFYQGQYTYSGIESEGQHKSII